MTVIEYINRKNKILRDNGLDFDLVPEEQKVEVYQKELDLDICDDAGVCPYCVYYLDGWNIYCDNCVMSKNNNCCLDENSTYSKAIRFFRERGYKDLINVPGIKELAKEYNSQLENQIELAEF